MQAGVQPQFAIELQQAVIAVAVVIIIIKQCHWRRWRRRRGAEKESPIRATGCAEWRGGLRAPSSRPQCRPRAVVVGGEDEL